MDETKQPELSAPKIGHKPKNKFPKGNHHGKRIGEPGGPAPGFHKSGLSLTKLLRQFLEDKDFDQARLLIKSTVINAHKGNSTALKEVWDRIDGPVKNDAANGSRPVINITLGGAHKVIDDGGTGSDKPGPLPASGNGSAERLSDGPVGMPGV